MSRFNIIKGSSRYRSIRKKPFINKKRKSTKKRSIKFKPTLKKFGLNNEEELISALTNDDNNLIVDWVCKNINFSVNKSLIKGKNNNYTIYNIKKTIANLTDTDKTIGNNIFVITPSNFIGKGSWGKVYDAYIFDRSFYGLKENNVLKDAVRNKNLKIPGFLDKKIKTVSQAFEIPIFIHRFFNK